MSTTIQFDDQDIGVLLALVEDELAETRSWSQRSVALENLRRRIEAAITRTPDLSTATRVFIPEDASDETIAAGIQLASLVYLAALARDEANE